MEDVLSQWTSHWQLILGVVFMAFVLYLPKGIWGTLLAWVSGGRRS
jgi:branched-chain amino acid transport system permease protein